MSCLAAHIRLRSLTGLALYVESPMPANSNASFRLGVMRDRRVCRANALAWVEAQPDAMPFAKHFQLVEIVLRDAALAVVADNDRFRFGQAVVDGLEQSLGQARLEVGFGFAIDANDLLPLGDDARFAARLPRGIGDQRLAIDVVGFEQRAEFFAASSLPTTLCICAGQLRTVRLRATLAAPPGMKLSR